MKRRRRRHVVKVAFRRGACSQVQAAQLVRYRRVFVFFRRQIVAVVILAVWRKSTAVCHVRRQLATRGQHQTDVGRRRLQRARQILRVILHADIVRLICTDANCLLRMRDELVPSGTTAPLYFSHGTRDIKV